MNFYCTQNELRFEISEHGENLTENRPSEAVENISVIIPNENDSYDDTKMNQRQPFQMVKR